METATQKPFFRIASDMINFNIPFTEVKDKSRIIEVGRNICFYKGRQENLIQMISKDELNCVFKFERVEVDGKAEQKLTLMSYVKMDNFELMNDNPHNLIEPLSPGAGKMLSRLVRKLQNYKTHLIHQNNCAKYGEEFKSHMNRLDKIYSMDYYHQSKSTSVFVSELSFSILNWRIAERLIDEEGFFLSMVMRNSQLELLFCIFPKS